MITYIHIEINEHFENLIELSCNMEMQDDSFGHEFGTEKIPPYPAPVSEIEYNKELYSDMECSLIDNYITRNHNDLVEQFCDHYEWILDNLI